VLAWEKGAVRLSSSLLNCYIQSTCKAMIKKYIKDTMRDDLKNILISGRFVKNPRSRLANPDK
jgi:hypothetical protein